MRKFYEERFGGMFFCRYNENPFDRTARWAALGQEEICQNL